MVALMLDIVWLCHNEGIEAEAIQRDFRPPRVGKSFGDALAVEFQSAWSVFKKKSILC